MTGRVDRYPLLAPIYHSVFPNPKTLTAYDAALDSVTTAPRSAKLDHETVAGIAAKMENATSGPVYESAMKELKRCVWLQGKKYDQGWATLRQNLGPRGTDYDTLKTKDQRIDVLRYKGAPSTYSKFGFELDNAGDDE